MTELASRAGASHRPRRRARLAGAYLLMVAGAIVAFLLIVRYGAPAPAAGPSPAARAAGRPPAGGLADLPDGVDALMHVLVALAAVIALGRLLAWPLRRVGQPAVIGEVLAGILLGPSLLGPDLSARLLPVSVGPTLEIVAKLGVILYMFMVGLELDPGHLRGRAHAAVAISHASILAPFLLGALLAIGLYPGLSSPEVPFGGFALFVGVALSITAFPVLARLLEERGLEKTDLGVLALGCAATDDVTAWCLLALAVGLARATIGAGLRVMAGAVLYIVLMLALVRPLIRRLVARFSETLLREPAAVFVPLLLSAIATKWIGIHSVFGAFLLGALIPHDSPLARAFGRNLSPLVNGLLLPAFFAYTGMRTRIDLLAGPGAWLACAAITLVATAGKFGGTLLAGRVTGLGWRESAALGALMNARGLIGLVVLNIGLDLGFISPALFAMMVIMALVTTMAAAPALGLLAPPAPLRRAGGGRPA